MTITRRGFLFGAATAAASAVLFDDGARGAAAGEPGTQDERLAARAWRGLAAQGMAQDARYRARLGEELAVVARLGVAARFLGAHDVVRWARAEGATLGPGAGQAPASLLCFALGLSEIDPIAEQLVFERFVNWRLGPLFELKIDVAEDARAWVGAYAARVGVEIAEEATQTKPRRLVARARWNYRPIDDVLASTGGVLVYDEQMIGLINHVIGGDLAQADLMRREFARSNRNNGGALRARWKAAARARGVHPWVSTLAFETLSAAGPTAVSRARELATAARALMSACRSRRGSLPEHRAL